MNQAGKTNRPGEAGQGRGGLPVLKLKLMGLIAADRTVTLAGLKVAIALLDRVNGATRRCFPSYSTLADDTGLSRRSAISGVGWLVAHGYVRKVLGSRPSNQYEPAFELVKDVSPLSPQLVKQAARTGENPGSELVKRAAPKPKKEPENEPVGLPQHKTTENSNERHRGTRLDPDWQPGQRDREYARRKDFTDAEISAMRDSFVAHFTNGPGRTKTWIRWSGGNGAWGNWVRNQFKPKRGGDRQKSGGIVAGTLEDIAALEGEA